MIQRALFYVIALFWVAMNFFLWRMEYGSHGGEISVPPDLVWRKILTAPDVSSLSVFQNGERTGFCQISTSIEQEMANLDEDKPPPEGLIARAGYQIRLNGNVSLGEFTNRVRFDGRLKFFPNRDWRELDLKLSLHGTSVEIHSFATNQTVQLKISDDGSVVEHDIPFAVLQNPALLLSVFGGNFTGDFFNGMNLPALPQNPSAAARNLQWTARRERLKMGGEMVSVYRLETQFLQNQIIVYVSTLGEILRVELPGHVIATLDQWSKP